MSSFKLNACRIGEAGAAGNKAGSGSSNDGQAGRSRFHLSPHALVSEQQAVSAVGNSSSDSSSSGGGGDKAACGRTVTSHTC